ncbi:MAG: IS110 family transposase [Anaerolineales bacterium]
MGIVGGFDVHRAQIMFDCIHTDTGEVRRGQVRPATRARLREWLEVSFAGRSDVAIALEGCTGWRFVVEELTRAGIEAHLAEPADTAALRGRKRRAKTDRADARHLRVHLVAGDLPECWIPPAHVLEARTKVRLYCALMGDRTAWQQRMHAVLFHQGAPAPRDLLTAEGRAHLAGAELSEAGRQAIEVELRAIERLNLEIVPLKAEIEDFSRRQPGCRALQAHFGIGMLTSVAIWAEMGDCRRFSSSDDAVRHTGLDITVWSSDAKRSAGHLSRQGPAVLRWALFEAAKCAYRPTSPDHDYYAVVKDRQGGNRATLSVARKLARRVHHSLRALGDEAFALPAPAQPATAKSTAKAA